MPMDERTAEALRAILNIGAAGLGAGAAARGLVGLRGMFEHKPLAVSPTASVPVMLPLMHVDRKRQDRDLSSSRSGPLSKAAALLAKQADGLAPSWLPEPTNPASGAYAIPLEMGAGIGGIAGGWKLIDWLMKRNKHQELMHELKGSEKGYFNTIRKQYHQALADQSGKTAEVSPLDDAFDQYQTKQSGAAGTVANVGLGAYLTAIGALGAGAAYGTYNWTKGRSQQKLLESALKARARQRMMPQPVYAVPMREEHRSQPSEEAAA